MKDTIFGEIFGTISLYLRKVLKIVGVFLAIFCTYLPGPRRKVRKIFLFIEPFTVRRKKIQFIALFWKRKP